MGNIYLLGVGRNTAVFIDLAEQSGYQVVGLYHFDDSRTGEVDYGIEILGSFKDLLAASSLVGKKFLLSMGDSSIRIETAAKIRELGGMVPSIVHPTAVVSRFATFSEGVVIGAFTHVQANTSIDIDTVVLSGVNISHDNTIGKGCFMAGGVTIGANTILGDYVFVGQGVLTISNKVVSIGEGAYIGAGALVTKSVAESAVVFGRPARAFPR